MIRNLKITNALSKKVKKLVLVGMMGISLTACNNEYSYNYDKNNRAYETEKDDHKDNTEIEQDDYIFDIEINNINNNELNDNYDDIKIDETYNDKNNLANKENINEDIVYDDLLSQSIINSEIQFNLENKEEINEVINSIDVEYLHSEYFEIEKAISKYNNTNLKIIDTKLEIINNNKLDKTTIFKIIEDNNREYLKENSNITKYKEPSSSDLNVISQWICDSINYELEHSNIDIKSLEAKLSKLKLFEVSDFTYGSYIAIDEIITYNKSVIKSSDRDNAFKETIVHEVKHLIQSKNTVELDNTLQLVMGINYSWNDLKVNSLYNEWIMESAAEKQTLNQMDLNNSLNYGIHLTAFDSIVMSMISKREVGELEKICMQSDLQKLYDYFDAKTETEKYEISLMLYAINIYVKDSTFTTANDFYKYYEEKTGYKFDVAGRNNYRDGLRGSVGQTLSKIFYKNLSEKLINEKVKIQDIFELIVGFELQLSYQCRCYDSLVAPNIQNFYSNYNIIQQSFFENIANNLNMEESEIRQAYEKYYAGYKNENEVSIISKNNQQFLKENNCNNLNTFYDLDTIYSYQKKYINSKYKNSR